ncbi:MAG: calcium-binding protein [Xenococcus sp. (in: cyanobacteria)]
MAPEPSAFLPNSFSTTTSGGLELNVEIPTSSSGSEITPPFVFQTGPLPNAIPTNFADGDFLLFTGFTPMEFPSVGNPGPLTITFETPVLGAGTQLSVDDTPSFVASISAFDDAGRELGTFSVSGTSSLELDNSAVFLGVLSDAPNISRLVLSSSEPERALGVNPLSLVTVETTAGTPDDDRLLGSPSSDFIKGEEGNDILMGLASGDRLDGGNGNDKLLGNRGNDILVGGSGHDSLLGGPGSDQLEGGAGNDQLFGGGGADRFLLKEGDGQDSIFDYQVGTDSFWLDGLKFLDLTITQGVGRTLIGVTETEEVLASLFGVKVSEIGAEDFVTVEY